MFCELLAWPLIETASGYVPVVKLLGTVMFTCTSPTEFGCNPQNPTTAFCDPIVAVQVELTFTFDEPGRAPSVCDGLTGPDPVTYAMIVPPAAMAFVELLIEYAG
jgi:hypothetical protein